MSLTIKQIFCTFISEKWLLCSFVYECIWFFSVLIFVFETNWAKCLQFNWSLLEKKLYWKKKQWSQAIVGKKIYCLAKTKFYRILVIEWINYSNISQLFVNFKQMVNFQLNHGYKVMHLVILFLFLLWWENCFRGYKNYGNWRLSIRWNEKAQQHLSVSISSVQCKWTHVLYAK